MLGRRQPLEIVVTVFPVSAADADVSAATTAVHALLIASALRDRGFRLVSVEGIEPCPVTPSVAAIAMTAAPEDATAGGLRQRGSGGLLSEIDQECG